MKTILKKVDAAYASELLQKNTFNRSVSRETVIKYKASMLAGEWMMNGEPIIVSESGKLLDGQHRLIALSQTDMTIEMLVVFGVSDDAFKTIDQGKMRRAGDILSIAGYKNCTRLASAVRTYILASEGIQSRTITSTEILETVKNHPQINRFTQYYANRTGAGGRILPSSFCGICALAAELHGEDVVDVFYNQVIYGENLSRDDPAFLLREKFISQRMGEKMSMERCMGLMIKAMNYFLLRKKIKLLRLVMENEQYPKIVGLGI